jgi:glucose-1-phosphate thymidylyltransferase
MKALILAAGYGTRLYPLTRSYPKALLKVGHKPIIDYIVAKLDKIDDIDEIIIVTNSRFIALFKKWARLVKTKKKLSLLDDLTKDYAARRGAIGDIYFAINKKRLKSDLLVIGSDNLFDEDLEDFLSTAKFKHPHPVIGIYNLKDTKQAKNYGVVRLDKRNRVIDFKEKPDNPKSKLVAMCLYYFPKEKLGLFRKYLGAKANKRDAVGFYIDWLRRKEKVFGFLFYGNWLDIGGRKTYNEAKKEFVS